MVGGGVILHSDPWWEPLGTFAVTPSLLVCRVSAGARPGARASQGEGRGTKIYFCGLARLAVEIGPKDAP